MATVDNLNAREWSRVMTFVRATPVYALEGMPQLGNYLLAVARGLDMDKGRLPAKNLSGGLVAEAMRKARRIPDEEFDDWKIFVQPVHYPSGSVKQYEGQAWRAPKGPGTNYVRGLYPSLVAALSGIKSEISKFRVKGEPPK